MTDRCRRKHLTRSGQVPYPLPPQEIRKRTPAVKPANASAAADNRFMFPLLKNRLPCHVEVTL